jgi:hypothetical protein
MAIINSAEFVDLSVRTSVGGTPQPADGQGLGQARGIFADVDSEICLAFLCRYPTPRGPSASPRPAWPAS